MFPRAATCSRVGRIRDKPRRGSDRLGNPLGPAYLPHPGCKRPPLSWFCTGLLPPQVKASGLLKGQNDPKLEGVTTFSVFPLPSSPTLCGGVEDSARKAGLKSVPLAVRRKPSPRCEVGEKKKRKLSSLRLLPPGPCRGARQGLRLPGWSGRDKTVVSLPRVQASSRCCFSFSPLPPCRGPPKPTQGRLRLFSGATPTPLRAASGPEMERGQLPALAEPELEPGGLAALGEGTGRPEQG